MPRVSKHVHTSGGGWTNPLAAVDIPPPPECEGKQAMDFALDGGYSALRAPSLEGT